MGSRLNVILKRDGVLTVSYSRIRANDLPVFLAFGPIAAWESLSKHQRSAALFRSSWGETEWINNDFQSVSHMIEAGDEGSVIVDWDDRVLWYFTDFDFEKYGEGFWGSWFASWVDVFWPDWEILRSRTCSFRDVSKQLGFKTELKYTPSWEYSHETKNEIFYSPQDDETDPDSKFKTFLAVVRNQNLQIHRLRRYVVDEDLIYGGPHLVHQKISLNQMGFETYLKFLNQSSVIGLVDFDKKQVFFSGGFRGEDANPFTAWTGWRAQADRQGLCSWIANTDVDWDIETKALEAEIDIYFEKILKWCTEVGPDNDAIYRSLKQISAGPIRERPFEDNPFPRKTDATGSITITVEQDNSDITNWLKVQKSNQKTRAENYRQFYEQMKTIYLSDPHLKQRILKDRHHSNSDWGPDVEAYAPLNESNSNRTVH
jgi:hypothetical protein